MKSLQKCYRVERGLIAYLKFILEAYEGIAVLSTLDAERGTVILNIAPGCEMEVEALLEDLRRDLRIDPVSVPAGVALYGTTVGPH